MKTNKTPGYEWLGPGQHLLDPDEWVQEMAKTPGVTAVNGVSMAEALADVERRAKAE